MSRPEPGEIETMAELRRCIDAIDDAVITLLAERQRLTDRAPALKAREGIAAAAPSRVAQVLGRVRDKAVAAGLDPDLAEAMWRLQIEAVIRREEAEIGTGGRDA